LDCALLCDFLRERLLCVRCAQQSSAVILSNPLLQQILCSSLLKGKILVDFFNFWNLFFL
jgi:hypothetical protein